MRSQLIASAVCSLVVLVCLGVVATTLVTGQLMKQGIDSLFLVLVCLIFAAAFSLIPLQAVRQGLLQEYFAHSAGESSEAAHGTGETLTVWGGLLFLTAIEVVLAYVQMFSVGGMLFILMALSLVKAGLIVGYFMHLKFERMSLVLSLIPAVVVVMTLLGMFFPDAYRLLALRPH